LSFGKILHKLFELEKKNMLQEQKGEFLKTGNWLI